MEVKKLLNELQYKYADRIPLQYNKDFADGMVIFNFWLLQRISEIIIL